MEIQKILVNLGQQHSNFIGRFQNLNLTNISMVIGYLIDIEIEILNFKNLDEFIENIKDLNDIILDNKCPMIISTDSIYTVLGFDISQTIPHIILLNHSYSGKYSLYYINKAGKYIKIKK